MWSGGKTKVREDSVVLNRAGRRILGPCGEESGLESLILVESIRLAWVGNVEVVDGQDCTGGP